MLVINFHLKIKFDLVLTLATLHNLPIHCLFKSIKEIEKSWKKKIYNG